MVRIKIRKQLSKVFFPVRRKLNLGNESDKRYHGAESSNTETTTAPHPDFSTKLVNHDTESSRKADYPPQKQHRQQTNKSDRHKYQSISRIKNVSSPPRSGTKPKSPRISVNKHYKVDQELREIPSSKTRLAPDDSLAKNLLLSPNLVTTPVNEPIKTLPLSTDDNFPINFFILILCPTNRIFELIEYVEVFREFTFGDIVHLIPEKCTDSRLAEKEYIGLCRPADRAEFTDLAAEVFPKNNEAFHESRLSDGDVLVAILKGYTGIEITKISRPILRNPKFKDLFFRRKREGKSLRKCRESMSASRASFSDIQSENDGNAFDYRTRRPSRRTSNDEISSSPQNNEYRSLCNKLEDLSKKLYKVDDEILLEETSLNSKLLGSWPNQSSQDKVRYLLGDYQINSEKVASELSQNIQAVFVDHNVEIITVDPEDNDEINDDCTFVSAVSTDCSDSDYLLKSFSNEHMELMAKPKQSREQRRQKTVLDSYEENRLAMQIEAMAAEADAVFERRQIRKSNSTNNLAEAYASSPSPMLVAVNKSLKSTGVVFAKASKSTHERRIPPKMAAEEYKMGPSDHQSSEASTKGENYSKSLSKSLEDKNDLDNDRKGTNCDVSLPKFSRRQFDNESTGSPVGPTSNHEARFLSNRRGSLSSIHMSSSNHNKACDMNEPIFLLEAIQNMAKESIDYVSNLTYDHRDCLSKHVLNKSASVASSIVAFRHGRMNEVHLLQYLGVTIVCIAVNLMQQPRLTNSAPSPAFGVPEIIQSAMFLAFMINGQRYLAKVTKKDTF